MPKRKNRTKASDAREVVLVKSSYQPTRQELEQDVRLPEAGPVTMEEFAELARDLVKPVKVRKIDRPLPK
ncbi:MAG: hypothetical protein OXU70_04215 [Gammaproteobacteria bacterium]|nr:hypothetical protein [Gammaproteobacteria bacterium]